MGNYHDADISRQGPDLYIVFGAPPRSWGESEALFGELICPVARGDIAAAIRSLEISTHRTNWLQWLQASTSWRMRGSTLPTQERSRSPWRGPGMASRWRARQQRTALVADFGLGCCIDGLEVKGAERYHLLYQSVSTLSPAAKRFRRWLLEAVAEQDAHMR